MSTEYKECVYNLWTGFAGIATCEAGYLNCNGLSCSAYTPKKDAKPQTNADRIRAMSVEEFAEWLSNNDSNFPIGDHRKQWLEWLQSPAAQEAGEK